MLKRQQRLIKKYLYILGAILTIILLMLLIISLFRHSKIENKGNIEKYENLNESQILKEVAACEKMLNDVKVLYEFKRELNALGCFSQMAQSEIKEDYCLQLPAKTQIYCLAPFARNKNNLEICKLAKDAEAVKTCLTMAVKNTDECQKYLDSCSEHDWPLFVY